MFCFLLLFAIKHWLVPWHGGRTQAVTIFVELTLLDTPVVELDVFQSHSVFSFEAGINLVHVESIPPSPFDYDCGFTTAQRSISTSTLRKPYLRCFEDMRHDAPAAVVLAEGGMASETVHVVFFSIVFLQLHGHKGEICYRL